MEQVFFNVPLVKLEPIFKGWVKDVLAENYQQVEPTDHPDRFLTIQQAAEKLNLTVPTMYSKVSKGEIPGVCKRAKRLYFSEKSLIEYIEAGRKKTNAEIENEAETYLKRKGGNNA